MIVGEVFVHKAVKYVPCSRCGTGRIRRSKTFRETLQEGSSPAGIRAVLAMEADHWQPVAIHPPCQCPYFTAARS